MSISLNIKSVEVYSVKYRVKKDLHRILCLFKFYTTSQLHWKCVCTLFMLSCLNNGAIKSCALWRPFFFNPFALSVSIKSSILLMELQREHEQVRDRECLACLWMQCCTDHIVSADTPLQHSDDGWSLTECACVAYRRICMGLHSFNSSACHFFDNFLYLFFWKHYAHKSYWKNGVPYVYQCTKILQLFMFWWLDLKIGTFE